MGKLVCPGRAAELAQLLGWYDEVLGQRLVLVRGPDGVGKSGLLRAFAVHTRVSGGAVFEGRCGSGLVLGAFSSVIDDALNYLSAVGAKSAYASRWLAQERRPLPRTQLDAAGLHKFMDDLVGLLGEVSAFRTPVVMLHNLNHADADTLRLLRWFFEGNEPSGSPDAQSPALFVGSMEPTGPESSLSSLERASTILDLGPLSLDALREYVQSDDVLGTLMRKTGGLPQQVNLLLNGTAQTLSSFHQASIDAEPDLRAGLHALAVLGQASSQDLVERCVGAPLATSLNMCSALVAINHGGAERFMFRSPRLREYVYRTMDSGLRKKLHAECARVLGESPVVRRTFYHAFQADDRESCVDLATREAESLAKRGAQAVAADVLTQCLSLVGFASAPASLVERAIDLLGLAGDFAAALVIAEQAWELDPTEAAARRMAALLVHCGERERAEEFLAGCEARPLESSTRSAEMLLAQSCIVRGDLEGAQRWAKLAREQAEEGADELAMIAAENLEGVVAMKSGDLARASKLFARNEARSAEAGSSIRVAQAMSNQGVVVLQQRKFDTAIRLFREATSLSPRGTRDRAIATENLAVAFHLSNHFEEALDHYHDAMTQMRRLGVGHELMNLAINLAELYLDLSDVGRTRSLLQFASRVALEEWPQGSLNRLLGRVEAYEGAHELAIEHFELALGDPSGSRVPILVELVRANLGLGNIGRARALLSECPSTENPSELTRLALVSADFERAAGGDPRSALQRGLRLAQESGDAVLEVIAIVQTLEQRIQDSEVDSRAQSLLGEAMELEGILLQHVPKSMQTAWMERPIAQRLEHARGILWAKRPKGVSRPPSALRTEAHRKRYPELVGDSPSMVRLLGLLDRVAPSEADVLVLGETGTGKELIANALHRESPRAQKPLIKVNCAALVETLLLSELFGHEKGAFTGATQRKKGRFELAEGGVLFLDEIGDVSPATQAALLRVLQGRTFQRVGGTETLHADVRIIAATNRDLERLVAEGAFRQDLYYRIRGVVVETAPLRTRREDIGLLCAFILNGHDTGQTLTIASNALHLLRAHHWPGNIRELESVLSTAALFAVDGEISAEALADSNEHFRGLVPTPEAAVPTPEAAVRPEASLYQRIRSGGTSLSDIKRQLEEEWIRVAYAEADGNITRAAKLLGMKRARLSQLIGQYGVKSGS